MKTIEEKIRSYSLKYIAECSPQYIIGMLVLPVVTFYVVWEHVPLWHSVPWVIASYVVALIRCVLIVKVRKLKLEDIDTSYWGRLLTQSSLASGCLWGLAAALFFVPDSLGIQLYIFLTVFVMASVTMILYAYWISAYYAFTIPSLLGVFVGLISEGSSEYYAFALLTLVYAGVVLQVARNQQMLASESLRLRFKQTELLEELQVQKEAAEAANLSKSKFLAAASHDLRQPLHSIGLFSATLGNQAGGEAETAMINNIDSAVASLDTLLSSLLDISKLDAGVVAPRFEHIDMARVIEGLTTEYEPQALSKGLAWNAETGEGVVRSDAALLDTVLRNLLSNAIRYTDQGAVGIACGYAQGSVHVTVSDTGVGIPEPRQKDVFQEFFQLSNPSRDSAKGVGLGLAIVDRLTRLLNIDLRLTSEPERGTEFVLRIPRGDPAAIESLEPALEAKPHDGRGTLVLVIDNHPDVLVGMKALLKSWHYRVLCATSEKKALRALALARTVPDVVLVDYQLDDGVTGIEVLKSLTGRVSAPFDAIVLTGDTSQKCLLDAHENNYKVLHKPVAPGKLRAMLINFKLKNERLDQDVVEAQET